ncbi:hypothetical protein K2173_005855 [Erythroxylum novogranatense]|uniref:RING-type domain-containing protein n=1 Tax=Erythroxylum novogranatense TaxID=1862640 RepID=A0AAV8U689_9ROSI|nr:hypothetical protein K2173_005855 [Erythroxylum novogranatense]
MGLSSFPAAAEGVLPVLVLNTVLSLALIKNMIRSVLQGMGADSRERRDFEADPDENSQDNARARERRVCTTQFKSLCHSSGDNNTSGVSSSCGNGRVNTLECCVCLCRFEAEEEVSELSCKHFFHKGCLDKWFDNNHRTCPLCRSVL